MYIILSFFRRTARNPLVIVAFIASLAGPHLYADEANAPASLEQQLAAIQQEWHAYDLTKIGPPPQHLHVVAMRIRLALCSDGKTDYCPPKEEKNKEIQIADVASAPAPKPVTRRLVAQRAPAVVTAGVTAGVDIEKLAYAVSIAETSHCTAGTGRTHNNCFGIRRGGDFVTYASSEESFEDFKSMWLRSYGNHLPTLADAQRYTAGEGTEWLKTVTSMYYQQHPWRGDRSIAQGVSDAPAETEQNLP